MRQVCSLVFLRPQETGAGHRRRGAKRVFCEGGRTSIREGLYGICAQHRDRLRSHRHAVKQSPDHLLRWSILVQEALLRKCKHQRL